MAVIARGLTSTIVAADSRSQTSLGTAVLESAIHKRLP